MTALKLLLPLLCIAGSLANDNKAEFDEFLKKYDLSYDDAEYNRRFGIFNANLKRIQGLKASGNEGVGINRFADTDPMEFQQKWLQPLSVEEKIAGKNRTGHDQAPSGPGRRSRSKRQTIPTSFDYRSVGWVTAVRNQGQCGSCWAFAAAAAQESNYLSYVGSNLDLSEQTLVDCEPVSYGCSGGWSDAALDYIYTNGMAVESSYPYRAVDQTCPAALSKPYKEGVYYYYLSTEAEIPSHVYYYGPVAFYFKVPASFQYYTGGVFNPADCTNNIIGLHEMLVVGYTSTYWIVKNSWGTGFGVSGYVYYARGKNLCGINNELIATWNSLKDLYNELIATWM